MLAAPNSTASPEGHTNQNASGGLRVHAPLAPQALETGDFGIVEPIL